MGLHLTPNRLRKNGNFFFLFVFYFWILQAKGRAFGFSRFQPRLAWGAGREGGTLETKLTKKKKKPGGNHPRLAGPGENTKKNTRTPVKKLKKFLKTKITSN